MIYIDTSSLLKLAIRDSLTPAVHQAISAESAIMLTPLAELEAAVQLKGLLLGGTLSPGRWRRLQDHLRDVTGAAPFVRGALASTVFTTALHQHRGSKIHCRSLDRLHLAAMQELGVKRLMSHDLRQIDAARELGFEVSSPGL